MWIAHLRSKTVAVFGTVNRDSPSGQSLNEDGKRIKFRHRSGNRCGDHWLPKCVARKHGRNPWERHGGKERSGNGNGQVQDAFSHI